MEQSGVLVGPIKFVMGNPEVAWFKSRSRYFFLRTNLISLNLSIILCPDRIMVLHEIANLDPSGCAGSIPAQGVQIWKKRI